MYDPTLGKAFASTIPRNGRRAMILAEAQKKNDPSAEVWWEAKKKSKGKNVLHAEDDAWFEWETSGGKTKKGSKWPYPKNSIVAVWASFNNAPSKEYHPCEDCGKMAEVLGVAFKNGSKSRGFYFICSFLYYSCDVIWQY